MTPKMDRWEALMQSMNRLQQKVEKLSEEQQIIAPILEERLRLLERDADQLVDGSYTTSDAREIPFLLDCLYRDSTVSSIHTVSRIGGWHAGTRSGNSLEDILVGYSSEAKDRGVDIGHLFLVDDWLRLAMDSEAFRLSKRLVLAGATVRVTDQRKAFRDVPASLSTYFGTDWYGYVTYFETGSSNSELPRMRLSVQQATEIQKSEALFQALWKNAQPLESV